MIVEPVKVEMRPARVPSAIVLADGTKIPFHFMRKYVKNGYPDRTYYLGYQSRHGNWYRLFLENGEWYYEHDSEAGRNSKRIRKNGKGRADNRG